MHPYDTVKIMQQTMPPLTKGEKLINNGGSIYCINHIFRTEVKTLRESIKKSIITFHILNRGLEDSIEVYCHPL